MGHLIMAGLLLTVQQAELQPRFSIPTVGVVGFISDDGTNVYLIAKKEKRLEVWNTVLAKKMHDLPLPIFDADDLPSFGVSPTERFVVVRPPRGSLCLLDLKKEKEYEIPQVAEKTRFYLAQFSPCERYIAVGQGGILRFHNPVEGREISRFDYRISKTVKNIPYHQAPFGGFSKGGDLFVRATDQITVLSPASSEPLYALRFAKVFSLARDGESLLAYCESDGGFFGKWELGTGKLLKRIPHHYSGWRLSPDEELLVLLGREFESGKPIQSVLEIIEFRTGKRLLELKKAGIREMAFSRDSSLLAVWQDDGKYIEVWDRKLQRRLWRKLFETGQEMTGWFSTDSKAVWLRTRAEGSTEAILEALDARTGLPRLGREILKHDFVANPDYERLLRDGGFHPIFIVQFSLRHENVLAFMDNDSGRCHGMIHFDAERAFLMSNDRSTLVTFKMVDGWAENIQVWQMPRVMDKGE